MEHKGNSLLEIEISLMSFFKEKFSAPFWQISGDFWLLDPDSGALTYCGSGSSSLFSGWGGGDMKASVKRRACILGKFLTVVASMDLNAKFLHFFQVKRFDLDPNSKLPSFLGNLDSINNMKNFIFFHARSVNFVFIVKLPNKVWIRLRIRGKQLG